MIDVISSAKSGIGAVFLEITSIINSVPDTEMYPCAFLDPTLDFSHKWHDYARRTPGLQDRPICKSSDRVICETGLLVPSCA
jgi:hypothetical protein